MAGKEPEGHIRFVGFWPSMGIPRQDYLDFMMLKQVNTYELLYGCQMSIYPVGLVVQVEREQYQILQGKAGQYLSYLGRLPGY